MKERVFVIHYQVPLDVGPTGVQVVRKYRDVTIAFRDKLEASRFFEENVKNQPWYDPSVCWIEAPELR